MPPLHNNGVATVELDLASVMQRRPAIVVTSKRVSGHDPSTASGDIDRWIDMIEALLRAGIDVWATIYDRHAFPRRRASRDRTSFSPGRNVATASIR
jgi:K+-sensing histidine kinase KdpD